MGLGSDPEAALVRSFYPHLVALAAVAEKQTGWSAVENRQRSQRAGFDHHLVKPVDVRELLAILHAPRG